MVSPTLINKVLAKAVEVATHSWEYGAVAEALIEWNHPSLSIFHDPFPEGTVPTLNIDQVSGLSYVKPFIRTNDTTLVDGDGSSADPASLGVYALLIGQTLPDYRSAAARQLEHLIDTVPRWSNGAISHREAYPELWADFIYMVPPFLAYYAVAFDDVALLKESALQCKHYRDVLITDDGAWLHIFGDHVNDRKLWSTSNGWATAGMARVLATLKKSPHAEETVEEQGLLTGMIKEILDGAITLDGDESGLLRNYLNLTEWWGEISGTSLLAATAFRVAVLEPDTFGPKYTEWAERKLEVVNGKIEEETGIVSPAVNPLDWNDETPYTAGSPEGQSFVVLLHAAYRDWKGE